MIGLFLSQARLRHSVRGSTGALLDLLAQSSGTMEGHHKLVWSLFDDLGGQRPFLFRHDNNQFLILSSVEPKDEHALWDLETKRFSPPLREGLPLRFSLRANPVLKRGNQKFDVVQNARKQGDIRDRDEIAADVGTKWFLRYAEQAGLSVDAVSGVNYNVRKFRKTGGQEVTVATIDFIGNAVVRNANALFSAVQKGIGPAKSYGCGLLLLAPV